MSEPPSATEVPFQQQQLGAGEDVKPAFLDPQLYQLSQQQIHQMQVKQEQLQPSLYQPQPQSQPSQPQPPQSQQSQQQQQSQQPSALEQQLAHLSTHPHDPAAWRKLIHIAESTGDLDSIRTAYDALLRQYPNTSSVQIAYITHFLNDSSTFTEAEDLFKKFLRTSPSVDLWQFYLTYVRRLNNGSSASTRDTVRKSYEFALNHVGQDKDSGEIWTDYIQFLKAGETTSTWEEQQKMDALRKVYHRAVQIPLENVEKLWAELEAFENSLNRITAKKFMADLSPAHMQARTVLRQLNNHIAILYPEGTQTQSKVIPGPEGFYLPELPKFDAMERLIIGKWKGYLKWEEGNPLEIEEKDRMVFLTRVQGVYRKAMVRMRYYTEIWFMAYHWTCNIGKPEEGLAILKQGMEANPGSFLLTFAYVENQEIKKEFAEVHSTYERFLATLRANLDAVEADNNAFIARDAHLVNGDKDKDKPDNKEKEKDKDGKDKDKSDPVQEEKERRAQELAELRTEYGLAWIMYMRFGRRAEGVKSSRAIFGKARKCRWTPWEVYEAAALMEYHCSNDKNVASRIFEKGLDVFMEEIEFVLRYLGFLISVNDENNARALFERVITQFTPEKARPLWERWARYEYQYGDLEASQKLEKRIAEAYPGDPPIKLFAQRHIYLGTDAIAARDLGVALARKSSSQTSVTTNQGGGGGARIPEHNQPVPGLGLAAGVGSVKRPPSPDYSSRKRDESRGGEYSQGHKRQRGMSPPRDRDRDRWDGAGGGGGGGGRRRHSPPPPAWERDERERGRGGGPPRGIDREDEKPRITTIPAVISQFIGALPHPSQFDGPVFRTEDLMQLFRTAVIPSNNRSKSPPPPPPSHRGGRPPPDYSPYTGPGGGGGRSGGRRY